MTSLVTPTFQGCVGSSFSFPPTKTTMSRFSSIFVSGNTTSISMTRQSPRRAPQRQQPPKNNLIDLNDNSSQGTTTTIPAAAQLLRHPEEEILFDTSIEGNVDDATHEVLDNIHVRIRLEQIRARNRVEHMQRVRQMQATIHQRRKENSVHTDIATKTDTKAILQNISNPDARRPVDFGMGTTTKLLQQIQALQDQLRVKTQECNDLRKELMQMEKRKHKEEGSGCFGRPPCASFRNDPAPPTSSSPTFHDPSHDPFHDPFHSPIFHAPASQTQVFPHLAFLQSVAHLHTTSTMTTTTTHHHQYHHQVASTYFPKCNNHDHLSNVVGSNSRTTTTAVVQQKQKQSPVDLHSTSLTDSRLDSFSNLSGFSSMKPSTAESILNPHDQNGHISLTPKSCYNDEQKGWWNLTMPTQPQKHPFQQYSDTTMPWRRAMNWMSPARWHRTLNCGTMLRFNL